MLALAAHILKLERYREDWHDPCARMTRKFVKHSLLKRKLGKEYVKPVLSREVWHAAVHGVAKSWTHLGD